jgi:hypothetical protein
MLDDAELEAATGFPVLSRTPRTGGCDWFLDNGGTGGLHLAVNVWSPGGRERFDILAGEMPAVAGVGDAAYQQGQSVTAVKGDAMVVIDYFSGTVEEMVALAQAVLADL